jgi:hypothetical protein
MATQPCSFLVHIETPNAPTTFKVQQIHYSQRNSRSLQKHSIHTLTSVVIWESASNLASVTQAETSAKLNKLQFPHYLRTKKRPPFCDTWTYTIVDKTVSFPPILLFHAFKLRIPQPLGPRTPYDVTEPSATRVNRIVKLIRLLIQLSAVCCKQLEYRFYTRGRCTTQWLKFRPSSRVE